MDNATVVGCRYFTKGDHPPSVYGFAVEVRDNSIRVEESEVIFYSLRHCLMRLCLQ